MLLATSILDASPLTPVEVARSLSAVPSAPSIVGKLSHLLHTGVPSFSEIGRLIRLDPGLACRVLREANEEDRPLVDPCFTIEDAINRLGFSRIHELVARVTRAQVFDLPLEAYGMEVEDFWRLSMATALGAELLAQHAGEDSDIVYALGLLHSVGMFAVDEWIRRESPGIAFSRRGFPRDFSAAEGAILGFTHAEVGAALLSSWHFTRATTEPIRHQYVPLRVGPHARLSCLLHVAKWLGAAVCSDDRIPLMPDPRYLDFIKLPSFELNRFVVEIRVRIGQARQAIETIAA